MADDPRPAPPATPDPDAPDAPPRPGFLVVGIGASAGGLESFKKFFTPLPADSGMAFVLIPHLDPTQESHMVGLLARYTAMPVVEAADGMAVEPNRVYVIPPNKYLTIRDTTLWLTGPVQRGATSIDAFFRSLADDQQERAVCVVLSGTGAHGTQGLRAVKAAGGMAMAEDPRTAGYDHMPSNAVATGLVDHVLPAEQMPAALLGYARHPYVNGGRAGDEEAPDELARVLALLRARTRHDFRPYRKKMLRRRVERRMGLNQVTRPADYLALLREHPEEVKQLARDLLIGVTSFFRDPEAFAALDEAVAGLVRGRGDEPPLRVWVPGCATGEEAYSVAMLFLDQLRAQQKACRLQVFGTDVDLEALEVARAGTYPEGIAEDVPPDRLARYFGRVDDHNYQVSKPLREAVVFAPQNLITDPPFTRLDLVCCRNLLIYLEPGTQKRVISLLHFALREGGYLFLGSAETAGRPGELFEPVSKKWRLYRRVGPNRPDLPRFPVAADDDPAGGPRPARAAGAHPPRFAELTQRLLLEDHPAAAVLITRAHEILYFHGPTARYLEQPPGEPTRDLLAMAREGLRTRLRAAVQEAVQGQQRVVVDGVRYRSDGGYATARVTVRPVQTPRVAEGLLLVLFEDEAVAAAPPGAAPREAPDEALIRQLEYDLRVTREDLQSTIEELESSNEELKASNEEITSVNEELQSTNEELETSKEELQSLNEELATVNSQLHEKVEQLEAANNDLANLLNSTDIATLFLDRGLRIKRYTPAVGRLFNLIGTDVGRPIADIVPKFTDPELLADAERVLRQWAPLENEVMTADGGWYIRRVMPYRTQNDRVEGVLLTFLDVTRLKRAEQDLLRLKETLEAQVADRTRALGDSEARLRAILQTAADGIITFDGQGVIQSANPAAERIFDHPVAEMVGRGVDLLLAPPHRQECERALRDRSFVGSVREVQGQRRDGTTVPLELVVSEVRPGELFTGIVRDVSRRKELEREVAEISALEQQRIGQELHDNICQELTGLALIADVLAQRLQGQGDEVAELGGRLTAGLTRAHEQVRALSRGLVPVDVDGVGLTAALEELAARVGQIGPRCTFDCPVPVPVHDPGVARHLLRIAQEAVNNAVLHARPSRIDIALRLEPHAVVLTVRDDGVGMPAASDGVKGAGMRIMKYRAEAIGGLLEAGPADGGGSVVSCAVPREGLV